jgi:hypothetical protein
MTEKVTEDSKSWVEKAVAFYKASGKRIALAEYTNPYGKFVQDEMYIYVLNPNGTMLAHGVNEKFVGEDFSDVKDYDGKSFIKEILKPPMHKGAVGCTTNGTIRLPDRCCPRRRILRRSMI